MTFAWVRRAEHDRIVGDLSRTVATCRGAIGALESSLTASQTANANLLGVIERLMHPPVIAPSPPAPAAEPDPVARVIREQSFIDGHDDHDLARHLRNYAAMLRRDGLTQDAIVGKLVTWQSTEDDALYDRVS